MSVLYLHIGTNKTGTSAIQRYFNTHRAALLRQRLLYPVTGCNGEAHYGFSRALGFSHGPQANSAAELGALSRQLQNEVKKSRANTCVISSEDFILPKQVAAVRKFFEGFECRVVVYLRRHDYWWESAYAQAVKMKENPPWGRGIGHFINFNARKNPNYGNYRFLVDRWADVFGADRMIVRPYEPAQNPGGVVADFLRTLGLPEAAEQAANNVERVNESLSHRALFILDILQRAKIDPSVRADLSRKLLADTWKRSGRSLMSPLLRRELVERNLDDYAYIAKKYLGRKDGKLFTEPLPDPDEPWKAPVMPNMVEVVTHVVNYCARR